MSYAFGFDFRASSGYVADPANCTYVLDADTYPTVRIGITFGWVGAGPGNGRDRDVTYPRIAGIDFAGAGTPTFQVDLPASGVWNIELGCGDWSSSKLVGSTVIKDNVTTLITINHIAATNGLYDATDTDYTGANWNTSETAVAKTFASTTLNLIIAPGLGSIGVIDHLFISQSGGATGGGPIINGGQIMKGAVIRGGRIAV